MDIFQVHGQAIFTIKQSLKPSLPISAATRCAHITPEKATAITPCPGKQLSPTQ